MNLENLEQRIQVRKDLIAHHLKMLAEHRSDLKELEQALLERDSKYKRGDKVVLVSYLHLGAYTIDCLRGVDIYTIVPDDKNKATRTVNKDALEAADE